MQHPKSNYSLSLTFRFQNEVIHLGPDMTEFSLVPQLMLRPFLSVLHNDLRIRLALGVHHTDDLAIQFTYDVEVDSSPAMISQQTISTW